MGDSEGPSVFENLSARPVAPARAVKVREQARKFEAAAQNVGPPPSHISAQGKYSNEDTYGLRILGCTSPGIGERPISANSRLGPPSKSPQTRWMKQNMLSTTDEFGDVMEVTDTFQKLKISRNNKQVVPCDGGGDGPATLLPFITPEEKIANATNGVTIKSLTSNTVVVVPETHRSNQCSRGGRPQTAVSSDEEVQIHPTAQKSKIISRRRSKKTKPSKEGAALRSSTMSFHRSLPDESVEEVLPGEISNTIVTQYDSESISDVGADLDRDYGIAPPTAVSGMSTRFGAFELVRPETSSSEILGDGNLASDEDRELQRLMKALEIQDDEHWYNPSYEDDDSTRSKLLQLIKLFYVVSLSK